jgi:hypothetical protein
MDLPLNQPRPKSGKDFEAIVEPTLSPRRALGIALLRPDYRDRVRAGVRDRKPTV